MRGTDTKTTIVAEGCDAVCTSIQQELGEVCRYLGTCAHERVVLVKAKWPSLRCWQLESDTPRYVFKRWLGADQFNRLAQELSVTSLLAVSGVTGVVSAIECIECRTLEGEVVRWSVYPYVSGKSLADVNGVIASPREDAARLLASIHLTDFSSLNFHHTSHNRFFLVSDALSAGDPDGRFAVLSDDVRKRIHVIVNRWLPILLSFPCVLTHGDFNYDNILLDEINKTLSIIDFEYARVDSRLLDLACLRAPIREKDGSFLFLRREVYLRILKAYVDALGINQLVRDELELLPTATVLLYALIVYDTWERSAVLQRHAANLLMRFMTEDADALRPFI